MNKKKTVEGAGARRWGYAAQVLIVAALALAGCAGGGASESPRRQALMVAKFDDLPSWQQDTQVETIAALRRSCPRLANGDGTRIQTGAGELHTTAEQWRKVCTAAEAVGRDNRAARVFFERYFDVLAVGSDGRFTGYYEPEIKGSRVPSRRFTIPVYRRPPDLQNDRAYLTRAEIENGALRGKGLEIAYVEDTIGLFEMHVQGSGRIALAEGGVMRLGFDGTNSRPYTALAKVLIDDGSLKADEATWPGIRTWLQKNPTKARETMRRNERYVFFKDTGGAGAVGAQGVALTSGRSMAVDPAFVPYGLPVYIDTSRPAPNKPGETLPFRRLMVAQDTGAAIKGPVRGDVFFGAGSAAADTAGRMNSTGRWWILVPKRS
ncbi:murein transglycosylase A [Reyranella sp. CPCC 100927]|uniref:murein transglycosylase A n=1 Tax=Reyranella sp. CPCC 100927 TaxID=2599616 RepID=UPI0011B84860|nr:MltA domain-containing protein [Reyranella sp. CPCC 100927]TWT02635.1 murein transglycosylase [Reyranella sp. CPCC 100927]